MAVELAIGGALALGKLFSDSSAASQRKEALGKYRKKLIDSMYDPIEKEKAMDRVGDIYNTSMADAMNSSAFGYNKFLNSNTARAVSLSKMSGVRSGAIVDEGRRIDDYNKGMEERIAALELEEPQFSPLGSVLEGGMAGLQVGMSLGNYLDEKQWGAEMLGKLKQWNPGNKDKEDIFKMFGRSKFGGIG
jgi:hypothetical protein